ncbi:MAG: VWA domain-containing protein [Acidobacteriota bacterium]
MNRRKLGGLLAALLLVNSVVAVSAQSGRKDEPQTSPVGSAQRRGKTPSDPAPPPTSPSTRQPSDQAPPSTSPSTRQPSAQNPPARDDGPVGSQDDSSTIKIDTTLVSIPVSVLDRDGKYVPSLTKRDFQLFEDGIEQEIADFGPVEVPFHVVLMLDTSRSTAFRHEDIQQAAIAFVEQLRPEDRVMVISFDDKIYIDSEFTSDRAKLRRAIYGTRIGGGTKLFDAVDLVISERLDRVEGRKAIVLFTDGMDSTSKFAKAATTLDQVEESGVLVYPIRYSTAETLGGIRGGGNGRGQGPVITSPWPIPPIQFPRRRGNRRWPLVAPLVAPQWPPQWPQGGPQRGGGGRQNEQRGEQYLRDLASRSGARLYEADTLQNLDSAFASIADELRHQYALSYYPTNSARDGSFRRIRVRVGREGVVVRARDGYRAADQHAASNGNQNDGRRERPSIGRDRP